MLFINFNIVSWVFVKRPFAISVKRKVHPLLLFDNGFEI